MQIVSVMATKAGKERLCLGFNVYPDFEFALLRPYRPREKLFGCIPGPSTRALTDRAFSPELTPDSHSSNNSLLTDNNLLSSEVTWPSLVIKSFKMS